MLTKANIKKLIADSLIKYYTDIFEPEFSAHTHNYAGSSSPGGSATTADKVSSNLIIKINNGTTEGTDRITYNGSENKTLNINTTSNVYVGEDEPGDNIDLWINPNDIDVTDFCTVEDLNTLENKFNNLTIGGANLLPYSSKLDGGSYYTKNGVVFADESFKGNKVVKGAGAWTGFGINLRKIATENKLNAGNDLTYSVWHKSDDTVPRKYKAYLLSSSSHLQIDGTYNNTNGWHRFSFTFKVTEDMLDASSTSSYILRIVCTTASTSGCYQYWSSPKLELGNIVTDWIPSNNDIELRVSDIETTIGDITTILDNINGVSI